MKLHKLYKPERMLVNAKHHSESLFDPDIDCGDPFVHGEVHSKSHFENIGAYLMKDSVYGIMIRAGSSTISFAKHLEHI
jgi:hypothetical protein